MGLSRIRVLKTYDSAFAREAFSEMDEMALSHLAGTLAAEGIFKPEDAPESPLEYTDFLWRQVEESARERDQVRSFFVVNRVSYRHESPLYVSAGWPSAESYAKEIAGRNHG